MQVGHVYRQRVMVEKINSQYGEAHGDKKKHPLTRNTANGDGEQPLAPTGDAAAVCPRKARAGEAADRHGRMENAEPVSTRKRR
jgi:hypothetical protein